MRRWERICGSTASAVALLLVVPAGLAHVRSDSAFSAQCRAAYAYAGMEAAAPAAGIRAVVSTLSAPIVKTGHVGAWIGVGGPKLGPNGTDEWLQVGYASFDSGPTEIYYELAQPGQGTVYHTVKASVVLGEAHRLTVLEVRGTPGSWRAWVDDTPVTPVIPLAASHDRFAPLAVGESWNAGTHQCNRYDYRFSDVQVATHPGGPWVRSRPGRVWHDAENRLVRLSATSFDARSPTPAAQARG
jgi:hypothetical protein